MSVFVPRIKKAEPLDGYKIRLEFADGVVGVVDLSHLAGRGVFSLWNERKNFMNVSVENGRWLSWGGEIEIDADSLYLKVTGKNVESLFPASKEDPAYA